MTYSYERDGHVIDREFDLGKAPPFVRHKGKRYSRLFMFASVIKLRHRAVGDAEDRAFKQSARVDYDAHERKLESHLKKQEQDKKG